MLQPSTLLAIKELFIILKKNYGIKKSQQQQKNDDNRFYPVRIPVELLHVVSVFMIRITGPHRFMAL